MGQLVKRSYQKDGILYVYHVSIKLPVKHQDEFVVVLLISRVLLYQK